MEKGVIAKGEILSESNGQRWIVGSFIGLNGITESYEAASYDDKTPTVYPAVLQIVPRGDEPLPTGFQFYLDHAKPNDLDDWKRVKHVKHLGIPVLLGAGSLKTNGLNYQFIIIERHGKDLWSLLLEHDKKFEEHTVYKITLQILTVLKYTHSKLYVHEDIKASNLVVDIATQNHIYLMDGYVASRYSANDEQVDPDKTGNGAAELLSRDTQMGVSTMRGDMEMLFYNIVQWLGIELPWAKNFKNPSLVLTEKKKAFADVDNFLKNWSKKITIPTPVCEYMKLLATMDTDDQPIYCNFTCIFVNGLRKLYHVPTGNLEFSISNISTVEQMAENSNQVNEPQRRRKKYTSIPNLGISVAKLANIIAENCRHECEVKLQEVGPDSLIDIIFRLTMRKKSQTIQYKIAKAWDRDTAGFKTMTKRLWEEKASKAKNRTTNKEALTEKGHEKPNQKTPTMAAASTKASTSGLNRRNPNISQSHPVAMSPSETSPPQEDLASLNPPNIFPPNVRQTLQDARSASPSRSTPVQSPLCPTSSSGYSSRCSSRVGFHPEDFPPFRTPEPFLEKEPCQLSKEVAVQSTEEADSNVETVTECWKSESVDGDQWLNAYEWLNTWLDMKEKDFGRIPSESVTSQVQQVRVLMDDFCMRNPRICQLTNVLAKLPRDSADAPKLNRIQQRWRDQLNWLHIRGRELGEASLGQLRNALQGVSSNLDKLPDQNPEEQLLGKMEILAEQLEGQRALLASAGTVTEQLCQAFSDPAFNADLRNEFRSVNNLYDDLQHRINVKKADIERSLSDERHFDDSCKKIIVWLAKERDMPEKLIVSADPEKLQQQQQHYQRVMGKDAEVNELLEKSLDFLSRPQNRENVTQQSLHDLMKSEWDRLKRNSLHISSRLRICTEQHNNYCQAQKLLVAWLSKIEHQLGSLQPATLDVVEKALSELSSLRTEIREKSEEFEQCTNLGDTFVNACDEDKNLVNSELIAMKDRWEKLNNDLRERTQFLEDTACRFAVFSKRLNKLERRVDELKSHDALQKEAGDPNLIDCIKGLQKEADSLRRPLEDVRQLANELASKVGKQGIDAKRLLKEVDRVAASIDNVKTKLAGSLNKAYEQKLASIEKDTKPAINIPQEQDVKPRILPSNTNQLSEELVDLVSSSEGEADFATDEKPNVLLFNTNPSSQELINLVSSSDSEAETFTPQQERFEPCARTHEVLKNGEQSSKADNQEQKSNEKSSKEKNDVNSVSSNSVNDKSKSSKKKRKRPLCILSDSDDSGSDYDEKKMKRKNSRKERE